MQVWLQRTVGFIALISLFFWVQISGVVCGAGGFSWGAEGAEAVAAFAMYRIGHHSHQVR